MSETGIKGIVLDKISLNAANIAFMRKLEEFDCAVVMDEQGNDKIGKAELAAANVLTNTDKPSVLIITTEKLMYAWYQNMLLGIGADFKFITANPSAINYFSTKISNLYITNEKAGSNPIFEKIKKSGLVWDLVIIDGGMSRLGLNTDLILNSFDIRTKKLAVFATYLKQEPDAAAKLSKLPEKFLLDGKKAEYFKKNHVDESAVIFNLSSPYICDYPKESLLVPDIKIVDYEYNKEILQAKKEQTNATMYGYGGNIFEELTLDMRKLYNLDKYDDKAASALKEFDSKLNAYINRISSILEDPDARIITYFSSEKTLDYVYKILCSTLIGLKSVTAIKKSSFYRISETESGFSREKSDDIRIVLSLDDQNEQCNLLSTITHVINYELPSRPLTLHRRFRQGGRNGFANPELIMFRDSGDQFDGRMLKNPLALNFCSSFRGIVPERNVYLFVDGIEEILADLVCRLEKVDEFGDEEIEALALRYNIKEPAEKVKNILRSGRDKVKKAFGLPNSYNKIELIQALEKKIKDLKKGCCFYDSDGQLVSKEFDIEISKDYQSINNNLNNEPMVKLQQEARKELDKAGEKNIIGLLSQVKEKDKAMVYYCAWRYLAENHKLEKDYNRFLKDIFEEVI